MSRLSGVEIRIARFFAQFLMRRTAAEGSGPPSYFSRKTEQFFRLFN